MTVKKLQRSRDDRFIAGVCGGLGEYFGISPALFRALAVFLLIANGLGGIAYIVCWIVIPESGEVNEREAVRGGEIARTDYALIWALSLIGLGAFFLVQNFYPELNLWRLWPLALVAIGVQMLINNKRQ